MRPPRQLGAEGAQGVCNVKHFLSEAVVLGHEAFLSFSAIHWRARHWT
jgi:hypothetical protein